MHCPNCGTENAPTNRFCLSCGHQLPTGVSGYRKPSNAISEAATCGALACIVGGGMVTLGWLLPWFGVGGIANSLLRSLNLGGSGFGLNLTSGVGNGLQMTLFGLLASFAALTDDNTAFLGLFGLLITGVLVLIVVLGVLNIRLGIKCFEYRRAADVGARIESMMQALRGRSTGIFIIMLGIFILFSVIPFGTSVLSGGFYFTALGAVVSYFGAFYVQARLRVPEG